MTMTGRGALGRWRRAMLAPSRDSAVEIGAGAVKRLLLLTGVACCSTPLAAQGVRLDFGLFIVRPSVDARSGEVFAGLGRFQPGIGADFGIGYDARTAGVTMSGGFAGVEVGAPMKRNGIDMGREPGLYRSAALLAHWRPSRRIQRWRPVFSVGYVRSNLDNVLLRADSLPAFARTLTDDPPDTVRRLVGVSGSGARVGISLERTVSAADFSGRMALSIEATTDIVRFRTVSYAGRRAPIPDARAAVSPRVAVFLRWSPRAAADLGSRSSQKTRSTGARSH